MRYLIWILLFVPGLALADRWQPYTDGRVGGCFIGVSGNMYGCTPQPPPPSARREPPQVIVQRETVVIERGPTQAEIDAAAQRAVANAEAAEANRRQAAWKAESERAELNRLREEAPAERARVNSLENKAKSCADHLQGLGYTLMRGGVCKDPQGAFVTCPGCPRED